MKWLALFVSFFFLVTHELVPHRHHEELTENEHQREHQEAQNVIDFLSLVFHQNLGGHHLQEILVASTEQEIPNHVQVQKIKFSQIKPYSELTYISKNKSSKTIHLNDQSNPYFLFLSSNHQRRGPPVG
jgi:hypothetical protein